MPVKNVDLDKIAKTFNIDRPSLQFARRSEKGILYIATPRLDGTMRTPWQPGELCEVCGDELEDGIAKAEPQGHVAGCGKDVELTDPQWDLVRKYLIKVTADICRLDASSVSRFLML